MRRKGRKIATLGPGDFFGELALLAGVPRTATVIAETDMVVEALNRAEFATLLDESPSIARKVLSAVAKRSYDNEPSRSTDGLGNGRSHFVDRPLSDGARHQPGGRVVKSGGRFSANARSASAFAGPP